MFVMSWVCTSPSVEAPVSLQQGNVRSRSSILCFCHVKKQQTLRKLKTSPASRPELFHLCQMATKRMFRSLSPDSRVQSNFEGRAVLPRWNCSNHILHGFCFTLYSHCGVLIMVFKALMVFVLLCIDFVGFLLRFVKH